MQPIAMSETMIVFPGTRSQCRVARHSWGRQLTILRLEQLRIRVVVLRTREYRYACNGDMEVHTLVQGGYFGLPFRL